jgi:hypothetical protein
MRERSILFPRLVRLYERHGYQVLSSVAPLLWVRLATDKSRPLVTPPNDRLFTYILSNDVFCSGGGGLHMTEIYFLECLAEVLSPSRIFVIGNAFGWSTLALALGFPEARVVAIDSDGVPGGNRGVAFTNAAAEAAGLNATAVVASSPQDVQRVVDEHLGGPIDLVLIDGDHTNEQQSIDFEACRAVASPDCVYLLHDVLNWDMIPGLKAIAAANEGRLNAELLTRTASGMAILYPPSLAERLNPLIKVFVDRYAFRAFNPV